MTIAPFCVAALISPFLPLGPDNPLTPGKPCKSETLQVKWIELANVKISYSL